MLGAYTLADFTFLMLVSEFFEIRHRAGLLISICALLIAEVAIAAAPVTSLFTGYLSVVALVVVIGYILYSTASSKSKPVFPRKSSGRCSGRDYSRRMKVFRMKRYIK